MSDPLPKIGCTKLWYVANGAICPNLFGCWLETSCRPELLSGKPPDDLLLFQNSFINARGELFLPNPFDGTSFWLKVHDAQEEVAELYKAVNLARQAIDSQ